MRQKELMGTSKYSFAAILHCLLPHLFGSNAQQNPILLALFAFKLRQNPTQSCVPLVFRGALSFDINISHTIISMTYNYDDRKYYTLSQIGETKMKKIIIIGFISVAVLLSCATFFDLQIDKVLYNPQSSFGKLFALLGVLPQCVLSFLAPSMVMAVLIAKRNKINTIGIIILILFSFICTYPNLKYLNYGISSRIHLSTTLTLCLLVLILCALVFIALPFAKKNSDDVLKTALIGLLIILVGEFILNTLKIHWGRQRFFTMSDPDAQFTKWFLPQSKAVSDNFKSFPSGHSFSAMLALWFSLFPSFIFTGREKINLWSKIIFTLGIIFGLATMFSRLVLGKHFLSDVTMGALISLLCFLVFKYIADKNFDKIKTLCFKKD
ncbi:MAG: hypothetical protein Ta2B_23780 [Termitinemataceae bacterium]|nr:MAG: hypothetical protein Ta2B_23780 [Termitinemataceae bacterium]